MAPDTKFASGLLLVNDNDNTRKCNSRHPATLVQNRDSWSTASIKALGAMTSKQEINILFHSHRNDGFVVVVEAREADSVAVDWDREAGQDMARQQ